MSPKPTSRMRKPAGTKTPKPADKKGVYIDVDDRTNRILMIGLPEQIAVVDKLIDDLDVNQYGLKYVREYVIKHVDSTEIIDALNELGLARATGGKKAGAPAAAKGRKPTPAVSTSAGQDQPQIYIQEATNSLLVNATEEQHESSVS